MSEQKNSYFGIAKETTQGTGVVSSEVMEELMNMAYEHGEPLSDHVFVQFEYEGKIYRGVAYEVVEEKQV